MRSSVQPRVEAVIAVLGNGLGVESGRLSPFQGASEALGGHDRLVDKYGNRVGL